MPATPPGRTSWLVPGEWRISALTYGLAQLLPQARGGLVERLQHPLFIFLLLPGPSPPIAGSDVDGVQVNHVMAAESRNDPVSMAFTPSRTQISRATSLVTCSSGGRSMKRKAC